MKSSRSHSLVVSVILDIIDIVYKHNDFFFVDYQKRSGYAVRQTKVELKSSSNAIHSTCCSRYR
jgi:hypothetical protein